MLSRKPAEENRVYCDRMTRVWRRFQVAFFIVALLCVAWIYVLPFLINRPNMLVSSSRDSMAVVLVIVAVLNFASTEIVIRYFKTQMMQDNSQLQDNLESQDK